MAHYVMVPRWIIHRTLTDSLFTPTPHPQAVRQEPKRAQTRSCAAGRPHPAGASPRGAVPILSHAGASRLAESVLPVASQLLALRPDSALHCGEDGQQVQRAGSLAVTWTAVNC